MWQPMRGIRQAVQDALDFAFPLCCTLCDQPVEMQDLTRDRSRLTTFLPGSAEIDLAQRSRSRIALCTTCQDELTPGVEQRCRRCAARVGPYSSVSTDCVHCRRRHLRFTSTVCLGMYEGRLRTALLAAKWSYSRAPAQALSELFWNSQSDDLRALQPDLVIPIPQSWQQRCVRYFNPAWIIADTLARGLSVTCDVHILRRRRRTRPQKRVSVNQRFENQRDAFRLRDRHLVRGKSVLLVDDVLTTGATCSEATRLLKAAGARICHVAVIGRVLDHSA